MEGVERSPAVDLPDWREAADDQTRQGGTLCIVVDTNVLLADFDCVEKIRFQAALGKTADRTVVVIPWIVLCELDGLKSSVTDIAFSARVAINRLNDAIRRGDPFIRGQSLREFRQAASEHSFGPADGKLRATNDDRVLQCCMHLHVGPEGDDEPGRLPVPESLRVLLLSNDTNLCSKALVNGIAACSSYALRRCGDLNLVYRDLQKAHGARSHPASSEIARVGEAPVQRPVPPLVPYYAIDSMALLSPDLPLACPIHISLRREGHASPQSSAGAAVPAAAALRPWSAILPARQDLQRAPPGPRRRR